MSYLVIKDPDWYLLKQTDRDKFFSNIVFLYLVVYCYIKKKYKLAFLFFLLFMGSSSFHYKPSRKTLLFDRITMVLVFSYFFQIFYTRIPFYIYSAIGISTVFYWYFTENLFYYFLYQALGLLLFLALFPMPLLTKILFLLSYITITYSQLLEKGKYHSIKHILLAFLSIFLIS